MLTKLESARIAKTVLKAWEQHQAAIDHSALTYLDSLIDEVTRHRPLVKDDLKARLAMLVPAMTLTTARHLIDTKYNKPGATELLGPWVN